MTSNFNHTSQQNFILESAKKERKKESKLHAHRATDQPKQKTPKQECYNIPDQRRLSFPHHQFLARPNTQTDDPVPFPPASSQAQSVTATGNSIHNNHQNQLKQVK